MSAERLSRVQSTLLRGTVLLFCLLLGVTLMGATVTGSGSGVTCTGCTDNVIPVSDGTNLEDSGLTFHASSALVPTVGNSIDLGSVSGSQFRTLHLSGALHTTSLILGRDFGLRRDRDGSGSFSDGSTGHATGLGLGTTTPKTNLSFTSSGSAFNIFNASAEARIFINGTSATLDLTQGNGPADRRTFTINNDGSVVNFYRLNDAGSIGISAFSMNLATDAVTLGSASVTGVNYISGTGNHTFSDGDLLFAGANGQSQRWSRATESHTLAAAGTSTTTTAVFPASSLGKGASFRITTAITGATSVQVGVSGDVTRYGTFSTLTAGQTIAISRADNYSSSTGILFTAVGGGASFTAGVIRVEVQYETATAPTS